jgi:oligopeptide transport system ATP-binding protein
VVNGGPSVAPPLVSVKDLTVSYASRRSLLRRGPQLSAAAVSGISFDVRAGETLGLVGESGCGKSTTGRAILRLVEPADGSVWFEGTELTSLSRKAMLRQRRQLQMIFQDPYSSLDGRMRVRELVGEPLVIHHLHKGERRARVEEAIRSVGLSSDTLSRFPHEFSGGQRQRIAIARALILKPKFVVCDEPTSSLDVSIQAQVLNLFMERQQDLGLSYLFISHDIAVVRHIASRIAVMYSGRLVEIGDTDSLLAEPLHPYTHALLRAVPRIGEQRRSSSGASSNERGGALSGFQGCVFSSRCPFARDLCYQEMPSPVSARPGHEVACHFWDEISGPSGAQSSRPHQRSAC